MFIRQGFAWAIPVVLPFPYIRFISFVGSWFILDVLYGRIFKRKTFTQYVDGLYEYKLMGSVVNIFLCFTKTLTAVSKFLIMKTSNEKTPVTGTPLCIICFISCSSHINSMRQVLLPSPVPGWKNGGFENLCHLP